MKDEMMAKIMDEVMKKWVAQMLLLRVWLAKLLSESMKTFAV